MTASVRVLSGAGRYSDPYHPFAETSDAAASILTEAGHRVEVVESLDAAALGSLSGVDLVVVNSGGGIDLKAPMPRDEAWAEACASFGSWLDAGGRALVLHTGVNTFRDWADWPRRVGGTWTAGVSGHPLRCIATFEAAPGAEGHPILGGLTEVTCYDERYWRMGLDAGSWPFLRHETDERFHDVGWISESGVVYDALGHNGRSYASPTRARLLAAEASWLLSR